MPSSPLTPAATPPIPLTRTRAGGDRGQATVELALAMPIVVVLLLVMVQAAIVVRDQIAVIHAAREGARAAAVSSGPSASAGRGARAAARLEPLTVATVTHGSQVTVTVKHVEHTDVPIVGAFLPDVLLTGSVTMQFEP